MSAGAEYPERVETEHGTAMIYRRTRRGWDVYVARRYIGAVMPTKDEDGFDALVSGIPVGTDPWRDGGPRYVERDEAITFLVGVAKERARLEREGS